MTEILKAVHIAAISIWMAGLICLPGLYVQRMHVTSKDALHRLQTMVRFAYVAVVSPSAFVAVATGTALIFDRQTFVPWFSAKLALVAMLSFVHVLTGLVIIRLFREGERYPAWRFVLVTALTSALALGVLFLVLGKPDLPDLPQDIFAPGALREMLRPFNPWATP